MRLMNCIIADTGGTAVRCHSDIAHLRALGTKQSVRIGAQSMQDAKQGAV